MIPRRSPTPVLTESRQVPHVARVRTPGSRMVGLRRAACGGGAGVEGALGCARASGEVRRGRGGGAEGVWRGAEGRGEVQRGADLDEPLGLDGDDGHQRLLELRG